MVMHYYQQRVNKYSMSQYMTNRVNMHIHAMPLELMLLRQEFDERNVFDVVFAELLKQSQNRECPKIV